MLAVGPGFKRHGGLHKIVFGPTNMVKICIQATSAIMETLTSFTLKWQQLHLQIHSIGFNHNSTWFGTIWDICIRIRFMFIRAIRYFCRGCADHLTREPYVLGSNSALILFVLLWLCVDFSTNGRDVGLKLTWFLDTIVPFSNLTKIRTIIVRMSTINFTQFPAFYLVIIYHDNRSYW